MEAEIQKFKVMGKFYVWKYKDNDRNYPGWNLIVDEDGSNSLTELLTLMDNSEWSSEKTVSTDMPSELQLKVPNNQQGLAQWKSAKYLTLNFKKQEPYEKWAVTEKNDVVEIKFGKGKLRRLQTAIAEIPKGKGDFSISDSDDENILYFWWNLEK